MRDRAGARASGAVPPRRGLDEGGGTWRHLTTFDGRGTVLSQINQHNGGDNHLSSIAVDHTAA